MIGITINILEMFIVPEFFSRDGNNNKYPRNVSASTQDEDAYRISFSHTQSMDVDEYLDQILDL